MKILAEQRREPLEPDLREHDQDSAGNHQGAQCAFNAHEQKLKVPADSRQGAL